MDAKIDYLSFTLMVDVGRAGDERAQGYAAVSALMQAFPAFQDYAETLVPWNAGGSRGHYGLSLFNQRTYTSIRFGGHANHILVEMPGTACQYARDCHLLDTLIEQTSARLTRMDVAIDIPDGCSPGEFVQAGFNERFKGRATITSADGDTEYIGSMKSERFARVYRYNTPHPRAGMLRIEHVLRADYAKSAAALHNQSGLLVLAATCGNSWGWQSPAWKPDALTDGKLTATRADRHEPGRVRWLFQVCIPALVKAERDGLLSVDELIERLTVLRSASKAAATA